MYDAQILADSVSPLGHRLVTFQITFPRIILAEFNTHRVFSRNSASSRAIPVPTRIKAILEAPFVPAAFGANQRGMEAGDALEDKAQEQCREVWLDAMRDAVKHAERLVEIGVHKQWANRLLEPFAWHTVIVTATEWENYFKLRVSEHAQPEIFTVSDMMQKILAESTPKELKHGQWHLPLVGEKFGDEDPSEDDSEGDVGDEVRIKLSVARCARVSYLTHDGKRDPEADLTLYERLTGNGHMSPTEHAARPMTVAERSMGEWCGNFRGWVQHRKEIPGEAVFQG